MSTATLKTSQWLIKREFWEHRGGFLWAPIVAAAIFLVLNIMGLIAAEVFRNRANVHFNSLNGLDFNKLTQHMDPSVVAAMGNGLDASIFGAASIITFVLGVVVFFYCINTLAEDRRDRSILFWKSLPISDLSMVLSKVASALVIAPLIAIIVSMVTGLLMLLIIAIVAAFHGVNVWQVIWTLPHPLRILGLMLKTLPLYVVWALPAVGWLMICSAWSRSKQFLWAVALPVGAGIMVTWFNIMGVFNLHAKWFWLHIVGRALLSVVPGGWVPMGFISGNGFRTVHGNPMEGAHGFVNFLSANNSYALLITPPFLIGAATGIVLIAGAVWLRRWRTEM